MVFVINKITHFLQLAYESYVVGILLHRLSNNISLIEFYEMIVVEILLTRKFFSIDIEILNCPMEMIVTIKKMKNKKTQNTNIPSQR